MQNRIVVAATDAAMDRKCIAAHWMLTAKDNEEEVKGGITSSK